MCEYVIKEYTLQISNNLSLKHMLRLLYQMIEEILSRLYLHM
jgi:hypothetical protein